VLASPDAAAVLQQPCHPYDPATELLFRDFCEVLVRLAAMRYPQVPRLELQVQQLLAQHLLPLLGGGAGRQGGFRQSLQARASITNDIAPMPAGGGVWGSMAAGPGQEQLQEEVVMYLQSQTLLLQQLFAALCSACSRRHVPSCSQQLQDTEQQMGSAAGAPAIDQLDDQQDQSFADTAWLQRAVTVRQVAAALDQAGWLQHWQLSLAEVSGLLLEGVLHVADPEGLR
jgi:hypothetical protein